MITSYSLMLDLKVVMPEIAIALFCLWALVYGAFKGQGAFKNVTIFSVSFLFALAVSLFFLMPDYIDPTFAFSKLYVQDFFSILVKILLCFGGIVSLIFIYADMKETRIGRFEAPVLVMLSLLGMFFMVSSHNLLTLYVGLEMQSLALYILASFNRQSSRAPEAGMKYFILGALASGLILFGMSFVYGFTGHTGFDVINASLQGDVHMGAIVGLAFIMAGFAFKLSAVPFHMWTPDVYHGAPASVTGFFALVPKLAAIVLLIRLLLSAFEPIETDWVQIVMFLSVASMIVGAFAGLVQTNIRRLLAYSAIGHMGYALVGIVAFGPEGISSVMVYMTIYMMMTAGVFAIILSLRNNNFSIDEIADLAGLSKDHPFYAYMMALLMFSMAGIPPLAGFFAKLVIFQAAVDAGYVWLAIVGVLTSVVASYYYLRIIKLMFFDDQQEGRETLSILRSKALSSVIIVSSFMIVFLTLKPSILFDTLSHIGPLLYAAK